MLVKNSEDSFRKDFPFYLAVAGRTFLLVLELHMLWYLEYQISCSSFTQEVSTLPLWLRPNLLENMHW